MSHKISLYVLLAAVGLIGFLFFRVVSPFIFAILFAAVLAVLFRPVYAFAVKKLFGWRRVAAAATTVMILLLIVLPVAGALVMAGVQLFDFAGQVAKLVESREESELAEDVERLQQSRVAQSLREAYANLSGRQKEQIQDASSRATDGMVKQLYEKTLGLAGDAIVFLIGFSMMGLALYYFLAEGETILRELQELSPLSEDEEKKLFTQFEQVCRGVVMGSVVSALVQATLAGIGFAAAGVPNVWLLMASTMFCAFIPFVGAGSVCAAVSLYLVLDERYWAAGLLFAYSMAIVATSDNLIKAVVIGDQAKLNPLVVLITVIGAVRLIGLWGIFVGPMVAAFFYALLKILRDRQSGQGDGSEANRQPSNNAAQSSA